MRSIVLILAAVLTSGCVGNIVVKEQPATLQSGTLLAHVTVHDLRAPGIAAGTREAAFGVPMGNVTFDPPEAQLIKSMLEVELTKYLVANGVNEPRNYDCDLVEFEVFTNTTPLYWDVVARIRVTVKSGSKQIALEGTKTERTYVWPGEGVIRNVVDGALKQIADKVPVQAKDF